MRFYYYRYKDSSYYSILLFVVIFLVCLALFFNLIIPQFRNWFSIRGEVMATQERISVLKSNIQFMNAIDKSELNSELQIALTAIPSERDFMLILNSLSEAAVHSVISLDDFNFQVGDIDSSKNKTVDPTYQDLSVIRISLVAHGQFENIKRFVQEIGAKLPLSEIVTMNGSNGGVAITMQFYQKSLPKITMKDDEPLSDVPLTKKELLKKLSSWKPGTAAGFQPDIDNEGSSSGVPLF
jgi:Tfp pilus assembly protein PilO